MGRWGSRSLLLTQGRCSSPSVAALPTLSFSPTLSPCRHSLSPEDWARGGSMGLKVAPSHRGSLLAPRRCSSPRSLLVADFEPVQHSSSP